MSKRRSFAGAGLVVLLGAGFLSAAAPSSAAAETRTQVGGGWLGTPALITPQSVDPEGGSVEFEEENVSTMEGDWVGVDHTTFQATCDVTGHCEGTLKASFKGVTADGSSGTVEREGTFTIDNGVCRSEQRIVGGTGDFQGSRGQLTTIGFVVGPGLGSYDGLWIRP